MLTLTGSNGSVLGRRMYDNLTLPPKVKGALQSVQVEFDDARIGETFSVNSTDELTLTVDGSDAQEIIRGYGTGITKSTLLSELEDMCNYMFLDKYLDIVCTEDEEKFKMQITRAVLANPGFDTNFTNENVTGGSNQITAGTSDGTSVSNVNVPRLAHEFRFKVGQIGEFGLGVLIPDGTMLLGVGIDADGDYIYIEGNDEYKIVGAPAPVNNDEIIYKFNGATKLVEITINGTEYEPTDEYTEPFPNLRWGVTMVAGTTSLIDCRCTMLNTTTAVEAQLTIPTGSIFRRYLGMPSGSAHDNNDPCVLQGSQPMDGDDLVPSIFVCFNYGDLETYETDKRKRFNYLRRLNLTKGHSIKEQLMPIPISFNNAYELNIKDPQITFLTEADGQPLNFRGIAQATVLFYEEED